MRGEKYDDYDDDDWAEYSSKSICIHIAIMRMVNCV